MPRSFTQDSLGRLWQACIGADERTGFALYDDFADIGLGTSIEVEPGFHFYRSTLHQPRRIDYSVRLPPGLHVAASGIGSVNTRLRGETWRRIAEGSWIRLHLGPDDERDADTRVDVQPHIETVGVSLSPQEPGQWRSSALAEVAGLRGSGPPLRVRPGLPTAVRILADHAWRAPLLGAPRALHLQSEAYRFLAQALSRFDGPRPRPTGTNARQHRQLHAARELLDARLDDPPPLPELARTVGLAARRLSDGFRSLFGLSIPRYVAEQRLLCAQELLQSGARVSTVAGVVGYTPEHFAMAFRRRFGTAPSAVARVGRQHS